METGGEGRDIPHLVGRIELVGALLPWYESRFIDIEGGRSEVSIEGES